MYQQYNRSFATIVSTLILLSHPAWAQKSETLELARIGEEYANAHLITATVDGQRGIAVQFNGSHDLHYYATPQAAPSPEFQLQVRGEGQGVSFGESIFPPWSLFQDPISQKEIEVYVEAFTVFLPIVTLPQSTTEIIVTISAQMCTSQTCLFPFEKQLTLTLDPAGATWSPLVLAKATPTVSEETDEKTEAVETEDTRLRSAWLYFLLAITAGVTINIMPCVLPVIPLIIMKLLEQSKQAGKQRLASGFAFCAGIIAFFALFALITAVLTLVTGQGLNPNDLYRYPNAAITLFLFIVFFGLVMLDIIPIVLPNTLAGKQTHASSLVGSLGMGFFAGVLSIPCSGALLGFVLVWAQTQPLIISSLTFILIGIGMALPYAVLISIPSLMERLPKPGTWMEYFKKTCGFLLFFIAGKLTLAAIPSKERLINVTLYGIVFAFCIWMWGKWVDFSTPAGKKRIIRGMALLIAIGSGFWLLPDTSPPAEAELSWIGYDAEHVQAAQSQGRPVLLKFTADWCTNCKVVEKRVFRDPAMVALIRERNILTIKADTTTQKMPATKDLVEVYGEAGNIPVTILLLPGQEPHKLRGIDIKTPLRSLLEPLSIVKTGDAAD